MQSQNLLSQLIYNFKIFILIKLDFCLSVIFCSLPIHRKLFQQIVMKFFINILQTKKNATKLAL